MKWAELFLGFIVCAMIGYTIGVGIGMARGKTLAFQACPCPPGAHDDR